jgi:hypothetical protein
MNHDPRESAVAESYPTFWEDAVPAPAALPCSGEDAYSAFVNLCEDEFASGEFPAVRPPAAD